MGRKKKKKENGENPENQFEEKPKINLAGDAKRSAVAIILFALAVVITLSFFGKAGVVGEYLDKITGSFLGVVKIIFPLFLLAAAAVLLFRKVTSFYVTKLIGLVLILLSIAGLIHWFYEEGKMFAVAQEGAGGGYVGYIFAWLATKYLGNAGGLVVILALFFVGIIVAFNFSILHFIEKLMKKEEEPKEEVPQNDLKEVPENYPSQGEIIPAENQKDPGEERLALEKNKKEGEENIGKIEFKEGRDQFISSDIGEKIGRGLIEKKERKNDAEKKDKNHLKNDEEWHFPPLSLLEDGSDLPVGGDIDGNFSIIEKTLKNFGIIVERDVAKVGPAVTQYRLRPAVGVKIAKILALQSDLSLALAKHPIRIEAPIPGESLIGIEIPNDFSPPVRIREMLESREFQKRDSDLAIALGKNVSGEAMIEDISKMPHLLVAGSTGTGKSVCINSIIVALLYQNSPEDLKFIMVDPKRVELSLYNGIPYFLGGGVIVENEKVLAALKYAVSEMEKRLKILQEVGTRDIGTYRNLFKSGKKKRMVLNPETGKKEEVEMKNLPYIVIVIDELSELMMSRYGKEVENAIVRIAQMARAVGIHLIVSTQRPSVNVITGLIKTNIGTRVAFKVPSQTDSRTILDGGGADKLLGKGDMLFISPVFSKPRRIQGSFITENEVKKVVEFIKKQKVEEENLEEGLGISKQEGIEFGQNDFKNFEKEDEEIDSLYETAKEEVVRSKKASTTFLQRKLRVGYARAARIMDLLEERGVIGPGEGAKPREIYASSGGGETKYENESMDQEMRDKWQM